MFRVLTTRRIVGKTFLHLFISFDEIYMFLLLLGISEATLSTRAGTSSFHSSAFVAESQRKRQARITKKRNVDKTAARDELFEARRPHPVLGIAPGDDAKWENCDLAKILIDARRNPLKNLSAIPTAPTPDPNASPETLIEGTPLELPEHFAFGIGLKEQDLLFGALPATSAQQPYLKYNGSPHSYALEGQLAVRERQRVNSAQLARIVDLSNANARGIAYENRRRCIEAFSEPGKPNDTGRSEVQGMLLFF